MADDFVKGLDDLLAALKDLPGNIEKNSLRTGVFRGAQFLRDKVSDAAPISDGYPPKGGRMRKYPPGTLKKSIKAKRRRGTKQEAAAGITGAFYAKWVEKGHTLKSHGRKADRKVVGHVPPHPFIQQTFEANKDQVLEVMRKGFAEAVGKALARLRSKMPKI
jgi:HK97 gp10 family phage protein